MGRSLKDIPPDERGVSWALWEKQRWRECKLIAPAVFERWHREAVKPIKEVKSKKVKKSNNQSLTNEYDPNSD